MINFLFDASVICSDTYKPIWNVVGFVVNLIWIGVPVILVVLGAIDLAKAVITSKEEDSKKNFKTFGRRVMYAVAVFLVFWIVGLVLNLSTKIVGDNATDYDETWKQCWNMMTRKD